LGEVTPFGDEDHGERRREHGEERPRQARIGRARAVGRSSPHGDRATHEEEAGDDVHRLRR
jgi:hypothetical protein